MWVESMRDGYQGRDVMKTERECQLKQVKAINGARFDENRFADARLQLHLYAKLYIKGMVRIRKVLDQESSSEIGMREKSSEQLEMVEVSLSTPKLQQRTPGE